MSCCRKCGIDFTWSKSSKRAKPIFCSNKCRGHTGFKPGYRYRISDFNEPEKLQKLKDAYEKHVIRKEGCWDWKGPQRSFGYGALSTDRYGCQDAHRASWIIHKGEIEAGLCVCHKCDNPVCSNPDHLFLGTPIENNQDKIDKGRANYSTPPRFIGENNKSSKLDDKKVVEIKHLLLSGHTLSDISERYKVNRTTIFKIKDSQTWKHIKV